MCSMVVLVCTVLLVLCLCLLLRRYRQMQALSADSFTAMPGPVSYPVLGTTYLYMQGTYSWDRYIGCSCTRCTTCMMYFIGCTTQDWPSIESFDLLSGSSYCRVLTLSGSSIRRLEYLL